MSVDIANTHKRAYTQSFDYAIIAFGVYYAIKQSQIDGTGIAIIKYIPFVLSCGFSMLSILRNYKWTVIRTIAFVLLFFIPLFLRIKYDNNVLQSSLLIMAAYNIPFSHIVRMCMKTLVVVFAIVLLAVSVGLIEDRLYDRELDSFGRSFAHDIGFKYYSYYSYLGMGFVQCCLYLWRRRLNVVKILFLILFSYVFFLLSTTRLQLYACVAFIIAIIVLPHFPKKILNNKFLAVIAIVAYPLICFIQYYVSKYFILSLFL